MVPPSVARAGMAARPAGRRLIVRCAVPAATVFLGPWSRRRPG